MEQSESVCQSVAYVKQEESGASVMMLMMPLGHAMLLYDDLLLDNCLGAMLKMLMRLMMVLPRMMQTR